LPPPDQLPWWFPRDFNGRELTRAAGVFDRLRTYGLNRIYPDYDALALATEKHEYLALKYEIEQMRQRDTIQGYVITELTDANWEANGLMSMWRRPKIFSEELGKLQQDDLVMANFPTHNYTAGSPVELPLTVSHYSTADLEGSTILWQTSDGQSGMLPLNRMPVPGGVATEGALQFKAAGERSDARVSPSATDQRCRRDAGSESLPLCGLSPKPAGCSAHGDHSRSP
jgi:hypothetical protein